MIYQNCMRKSYGLIGFSLTHFTLGKKPVCEASLLILNSLCEMYRLAARTVMNKTSSQIILLFLDVFFVFSWIWRNHNQVAVLATGFLPSNLEDAKPLVETPEEAADSAKDLSLAQAVQRIPVRVREALVWAAVLPLGS